MRHSKTLLTIPALITAACAAEPPGTSSMDQATTGPVQVTLVWQYMADKSSSSPGHAHAKYYNLIASGAQYDSYLAVAANHTLDEPSLTEGQLAAIDWVGENVVGSFTPIALSPPPQVDKTMLVITGEGTGKL